MLHLDTHRVDDVKLKNIQVESTLVTIFEDGVFGKPEVLLNVYHHFKSELEWVWNEEVVKEFELTEGEMAKS